MIRYNGDLSRLQALIDQHKPGWRTRARDRTNAFAMRRKYEEKSPIWGEVKLVFMELQGEAKCCYCEQKFYSGYNQYELDLEHYRPKRRVKKWACPRDLIAMGVYLAVPPAKNNGYYLLSYHLLNYAVACKPCNTGLKKDYFPISGSYNFGQTDPRKMTSEQPWLLNPIGCLDVDLEDVISFYGILPRSHSVDRRLQLRGLVTIVFFGLDDVVARKDLMRQRAWDIMLLHQQLLKASKGDREAEAQVTKMVAPTARHANCARSFRRLFHSNPTEADEGADSVCKFLLSSS